MNILVFITVLLLISAAFAGLFWAMRRQRERMRERDLVFLQILVPKKESKADKETESEQFSTGKDFREVLGVMEHLFESLHGIYLSRIERLWMGQPFFSMEY